jgi:hypothetical protein
MRHGAGAPLPPPGPPRRRGPDPHPQQVAYLQMQARGWLVMWSPWRRAWTAVAQFGPVPVILDHPNPEELLKRCRAAELSATQRWPARA